METTDLHTLLRGAALQIFSGALGDCDVRKAFHQRIRLDQSRRALILEGESNVDLCGIKHLVVIATGKGATPMLECLLQTLQPLSADLTWEGVLITPTPPPSGLPSGMRYFAGGHPLPNEASLQGARAALQILQHFAEQKDAAQHTLCLFLLSGGSSAMLELPLDLTIPLEDVLAFHHALIHSGASIAEINCVRKHFSAVKGGRLALAAGELTCVTLAVSDVPEGKLDSLGSGPTLPDSSTTGQCRAILDRFDLLARFPASVRSFFAAPALPETPKMLAPSCRAYLLLSSNDLGAAAQRHAQALGFNTVLDTTCDDWDFRDAAAYLLQRLREASRTAAAICIISPGEVTVTLPGQGGQPGLGGRNQQFALYAATLLRAEDGPVVILSAGSDGIDGNSLAAGAVISSAILGSANEQVRHDAEDALAHFNAFPLLQRLGATIITGHTGNNLRDLRLLMAARNLHQL